MRNLASADAGELMDATRSFWRSFRLDGKESLKFGRSRAVRTGSCTRPRGQVCGPLASQRRRDALGGDLFSGTGIDLTPIAVERADEDAEREFSRGTESGDGQCRPGHHGR